MFRLSALGSVKDVERVAVDERDSEHHKVEQSIKDQIMLES